ncbi:MAG: FtsX-like permease family protein [Clostridia bacterium]|nr:FtsX-like permease family protein [Clostridia bacterium]
MVISIKDGLKLIGISIVCCCAVFVCTFMLNYYMDVFPLRDRLTEQSMVFLYEAQIATAKFTSVITGGVLGLVAAGMLVFYIKIYVDSHSQQIGIIKALGYSRVQVALRFWVFGLSAFIGCALGFACGWAAMRFIYDGLTIEGIGEIPINFHAELLVGLVIAPSVLFTVIACLYAYVSVSRPVMWLLRGTGKNIKIKKNNKFKSRSFLAAMCFETLKNKKVLVFFVAFSCFCFAAMVQMGLSMENLTTATMGYMILAIGLILAVITMFMAITSLLRGNSKNISIMRAFGYSMKECALSVLGGFVPFAFIGFGVGTAYQYGLLQLMVNLVFADVAEVPEYHFNVPVFFITLASFIVCYAGVMAYYMLKINKISLKETMLEN